MNEYSNSKLIMEEKKEIKTTGSIQELHILFKNCLDILRNDAEHLIGDEALNELSHFLILKQSEKHITNGTIDIYNLELYNEGINKYGKERFVEYMEYVKFSKLIEYVKIPEKEVNLKNIFDDFLWKEVLCKHPKFKDVFEEGKKSYIKESTTIKKLILALSEIDFDKYDYDILGEAYESIFVDAVFGAGGNKKSELGQFFTPPKVKKLLVNLVNPKVKENGEIESVLDPASGTGGILNSVIKHFKQYVKLNKIREEDLHEELKKNIYGIEIKGKIYNLCLSNMLINSGEILPNVICADSIRKYHNVKVDNIIANPPFSVNINYDNLLCSIGNKDLLNNYIPIKAGGKNSEILFLQMMIHSLKIDGRCATVMLDGQKMYGSSSGYDRVREYLMKSCELHEVISCTGGTFTSTSSKTCILYFTKKKERVDVVEISGIKRNLKFCKEHVTEKVKFYEFNPENEEKKFIKEVSIEEIALKKYSLNYSEYKIEEYKKSNEEIDMLEFGSVCDKISTGKSINKNDMKEGIYPYYGANGIVNYIDKYDYEGEYLLIGRAGSSGKINYVNGKFQPNDNVFVISAKNIRYIYYVLIFNKYFENIIKDGVIPVINKTNILKIEIPVPNIEVQNNIVKYLDKLFEETDIKIEDISNYYEGKDIFKFLLEGKYDLFKKLVEWQVQSVELYKQIDFYRTRLSNYLYFMNNVNDNVKTIGEVCHINIGGTPRRDNFEYWKDGSNIWVSVSELNDNIITDSKEKITDIGIKKSNVKLIPKDTILYSFKLSIGKIAISGCDLYTNEAIAGLIIKCSDVKMEYLYYILKDLKNFSSKGCIGNGSLNKDSLSKIKIQIHTIDKQNEIIDYCKNNDLIIESLKKEIESNKKEIDNFLCILRRN